MPLSQTVESRRLSAGCATDGGALGGIAPNCGGVGLGEPGGGGGDGTGPDDGRTDTCGGP